MRVSRRLAGSLILCLLFSQWEMVSLMLHLPWVPPVERAQAAASADVWLSGWNYRKKITIDNANVDSNLTDFPLYVKINADTGVGAHALGTGYDIRFTSATGALLAYERESFSLRSGSGSGNFWVRVPTVNGSSDTSIYMYYGKTGASDGQNATGVWDSNFKGVWHLPDGSTLGALDSTSNDRDGSISGATATTGKADGGGSFVSASSQYLYAVDTGLATGTNARTISAWFKTTDSLADANYRTIAQYGTRDFNQMMEVGFGNDANIGANRLYVSQYGDAVGVNATVNDGAWHHGVALYNGSTWIAYVDGGNATSKSMTTNTVLNTFNIGRSTSGTAYFNGSIDEVRVSNVARSAAWIKFEYYNMSAADQELAWGEENAWLSGFDYRKRIAIDKTYVDSDLSNFPLYVKINQDADVGAAAQSDGDDIRFATSTGMILPYEEEGFSIRSGSGSGNYWVKVPTVLTSTGTVIYLYYGSGSAVDGQNATGVWEGNYKATWHLNNSVLDATSNDNDGTDYSTTDAWGKVVKGREFSGSNQYIGTALTPNTELGQTMTVSAWLYPHTASNYRGAGGAHIDSFTGMAFLQFEDTAWGCGYGDGSAWANGASISLTLNDWNYVHCVIKGSNYTKLYKAGSLTTNTGQTRAIAQHSAFWIGRAYDNAARYFDGIIDEMRVYNGELSVAWVKFEYNNMYQSDQEVSFAGEESNVANSVPEITSVTDSPDPVNAGSDATFSVDWNDADAEGIKMYICKAADGTSVGCGAGGTWCSNSNDFDLTDPITCSYTATNADTGTQNYYAYVCDDSGSCSGASSGTFRVSSWLLGFSYRKRILVDNTNVDSNLSNFPLYVKVAADTDIGAAAQSDGDDIRFATATGMILPHEEEYFSVRSGSGSGDYWVKAPTVFTATGTVIYLYYGSGSAVDGQNVTEVWDSSYKGVWHLKESIAGSPTIGDALDSTGNNSDGTGWGASPDKTPDRVDAKLSKGQKFDGTDDAVYVGDSPALSQTGNMTLSTWYKLTSAAADYDFLAGKMTDGNWTDGYGLFFTNDFSGNTVVFHAQGWNVNRAYAAFNWTADTSWHYTVGRYDGSNVKIDLDASAGTSDAYSGSISDTATYFMMGAGQNGAGTNISYFPPVTLDEVRLSSVARSDAWVKFEYYNMGETDQELSWSAQEITSGNLAPTISAVANSPDLVASDSTITFSVDWADLNTEGIKMYICKAADGTSAGCGAGGTWCSNSNDFDLTDPITCPYTATDADAGTQNYYAYVCDDSGSCSGASAGTFIVSKWLSGFTKRKRIAVDKTYVDSNLSNFPLYVKVNADTDVGAAAQADGDDIRFATATGMILPYEEESFLISSGSGSGNFWVKVPTILTSTGTVIYLYYGSGSAADGQSASGVWDSNYKGVWHLHQGVADSTSTANNGTDDGTADEAGRIGQARDFEAGDTDRISLGLNGIGPDLTGGTAVVTEAWVKPESYTADQYDNAVFTVFGGSDNKWYVDLGIRGNDNKIRMAGRSQDADTYLEAASTNTVSTAAWTHVVGILNIPNDQILFYKNGAPDGSAAASFGGTTYTHTSAGAKPDGIGAVDSSPYFGWFDGLIDEVRVSNVLRSAAWIKFEYNNMAQADQEIAWAAEESLTVILSGTVYSDEGSTPLGSQTVRIAIDGVDQSTTAESDAGDGTWSIAGLTISAGQVVTAYLEDETADAVTVTVSNGSGLADLDLYQDHLIVRADNGAVALTNANLATAAVGSETDISGMYSVSSSNITVVSGKEILVWSGDAYTPGGTVTTSTLDVRGTFTQGNYALSISSAYQQSGGTFAGGGAAITVTGTFTLSGGAFTSTSTTLTLYGSWAHTDGTFTHNGGAVLIDRLSPGSANTINVPTTATFNTLTIQGHDNVTTISDGDTLIVVGTFTWGNSNPSFPLYGLNGGTVEARAGVTVNVGARGGSTLLTFLVGGDQTITGGGTVGPLTISKSSGMVNVTGSLASGAFTLTSGTFASTTGTFSIYGNWTHTAGGTFNHNYGTVLIDRATPGSSDTIDVTGTETFNNLTIRGHDSYRTIAAGDTLIALGTFALGHTEMSYPLYGMNGGTIEARGNVVMNVRSADGSTALSFTGTGAQTYTDLGGPEPDGTITINKPSGTVTLASNADWNASGQDLAITSGTLNIAGYTLAVNDQFTIGAAGTLKLQGAETVSAIDSNAGTVEFTGNGNAGENTYTVTTLAASYQNLTVNSTDGTTDTFQLGTALDINGDFILRSGTFITAGNGITLSGDWIKKAASTFTHGDGTVTLDGTSQTMSGSTTFYALSKTTAGDTFTFESGSTQTIAAGGSLTLNGSDGSLLTLAPSVAETSWNLVVDATASQSVSYVSVSYSDASGGAEIDASDGTNTNGGGTINWDFGAAAPAKKNYFWFF